MFGRARHQDLYQPKTGIIHENLLPLVVSQLVGRLSAWVAVPIGSLFGPSDAGNIAYHGEALQCLREWLDLFDMQVSLGNLG